MADFPIQEYVNQACEDLNDEYQSHQDKKQLEKDIREMAVDIADTWLEADGVEMSFRLSQSPQYARQIRIVENMMRRQFGFSELH